MEREPYTYPFTEAEMQEIEAKAVDQKAKDELRKTEQTIALAFVPVWIFIFLVIFQDQISDTPAYISVLQFLFPALLLAGGTGKLLTKSKPC